MLKAPPGEKHSDRHLSFSLIHPHSVPSNNFLVKLPTMRPSLASCSIKALGCRSPVPSAFAL